MLYDPKWENTIKTDPFSVEALIAWLEKQWGSGTYNWDDCEGRCLIGLYGTAVGIDWRDFHSTLWAAGKISIASHKPRTFVAALRRARKFA